MKLILTSAGITNKSIAKAILNSSGLKASEIKLAFIPTAGNIIEGDKDWIINDLKHFQEQGYKIIDIVDIKALPKKIWLPRLKNANMLCFGGGDEQYLAKALTETGLRNILSDLLKDRLYIGISAGSMVAGQFLTPQLFDIIYPDNTFENKLEPSLGYVDLNFIPHLNSSSFPNARKIIIEKCKNKLKYPLYAMDDRSALKITNNNIKVISEGDYLKI